MTANLGIIDIRRWEAGFIERKHLLIMKLISKMGERSRPLCGRLEDLQGRVCARAVGGRVKIASSARRRRQGRVEWARETHSGTRTTSGSEDAKFSCLGGMVNN